jgi:uncharacterized RDD family membrane protein YckC
VPYPVAVQRCPACGQNAGAGIACQYCSQLIGLPTGVRLSSAGRRLGEYLLDTLLLIVTLFIGWFIWSLIVWKDGQSPAKLLLGMRVIKRETGTPATFGTMAMRELLGKTLIMGLIGVATIGIGSLILNFMLVWDRERQQLWDKVAGTLVVDDPQRLLVRAAPGASTPGSG